MKIRLLLVFFIICFVAEISYGSNEINIKSEEINTDYGIEAWLSEDHTSPTISMIITFKKAGYAYDTKKGLSSLVSRLLKEGTNKYDGNEIAEILENNGIILNYDVDLENFTVRIKTLSNHFETSLMLLQSMLTEPSFDQQSIERIKNQQVSLISKLQENPNYIAKRKFFELLFDRHPYANSPYGSVESVMEITGDDLLQYVKKSLNRVNLNIVVSGDINTATLSTILDNYLVNLPLSSEEVNEIPRFMNFKNSKKIGVYMDIPQSVVYFGKIGIDENHPDFYAAYLLNHIVGGTSLNSILMEEIRKKMGLTYGIYSWLEDYRNANLLLGKAATDNESAQEMVLAVDKIFENVKRDGLSIEKVNESRDYIINSFVTKMDTNDKIAEILAHAQNHKLGLRYVNDFCKNIEKVSLQDVNKIANSLLDTKEMLFVILGRKVKK
ncbi:MAG: insulinase family protein [Rickettsiaceae bacterium H1]|nr:insulinase family protein [Rickettsiaceae bacterium H1]